MFCSVEGHPSHPAKMTTGTLISGLFFISLANYRACLQGWQLIPGTRRVFLLPPVFTLCNHGPAICKKSMRLNKRCIYPWHSAPPSTLNILWSQHVITHSSTFWCAALEYCMMERYVFCNHTVHLQLLFAAIDGGVACDIAYGPDRLLLLHVRRLFKCWQFSQGPHYLLSKVSEWWLLSDLGWLSITSIIKLALSLQLPLNGKRCLTVCLCLWFHMVAGIWSFSVIYGDHSPLGPAIIAW